MTDTPSAADALNALIRIEDTNDTMIVIRGYGAAEQKDINLLRSYIENTRAAAPQEVDHIKGAGPGAAPLIRRTKDEDGKNVVVVAEWYWEEMCNLIGKQG